MLYDVITDPGSRPQGLLAGLSRSTAEDCDYYAEGTVNGAAAALESYNFV